MGKRASQHHHGPFFLTLMVVVSVLSSFQFPGFSSDSTFNRCTSTREGVDSQNSEQPPLVYQIEDLQPLTVPEISAAARVHVGTAILIYFDPLNQIKLGRGAVLEQHFGQRLKASLSQVSWPLRC